MKFEYEAKRVAAAFGVKITGYVVDSLGAAYFNEDDALVPFYWSLSKEGELECLSIGSHDGSGMCEVRCLDGVWFCFPCEAYNERMGRSLYCLGIEDEGVWEQLGCCLSGHDKMELQISLPLQFWPDKWLDLKPSENT
jgi:hypothetical protein